MLKLNRTLHLKADSESSQIRLSRLKSLHYWNNSRAGWNPLPAGQVQDWTGSAGFPSTASQSPSQNSATGSAGCCHPLLQEPDGLSSVWESQILCPPRAQRQRGARMRLGELTLPPLLAKPFTPALHPLLALQCRGSLGGQIRSRWFALCCFGGVSWVGLGGAQQLDGRAWLQVLREMVTTKRAEAVHL